MPFIDNGAREEIGRHLGKLANPVRLVLFTGTASRELCEREKELLAELASLSPDLDLEAHDFEAESALAAMYGVDKVPGLVVKGIRGGRVRFYGIPGGHEFVSLVESVKEAGAGHAAVEAGTREKLANLASPVHIQVFVTLNCPYCPSAVRTAHRLALEFPRISADMVEASEFPDLVERYGIQGVPKTLFNGKIELVGARPEADFVAAAVQAAGG